MDLGAGDGHFVLAHAAARPERFVLGVDASADAMREASRRAARPGARGGLPNARFVVAPLEQLRGLEGVADLVTVHFPWGSLRSAAAGHDSALTARLAAQVRPGGRLELLLADAERDGAAQIDIGAVVAAHERLGLRPVEIRAATLDDAISAHSSWGKRLLRHPMPGRMAWRIRLERPAARTGTQG